MALRIKLARGGSAHNPVYRIVVGEARSKRDGKYVEWIGTYSPKAACGQLKINLERAEYWVRVGAKPTDTVRSLINKVRRSTLEELEGSAPTSAAEEPKPAEEAPAEPAVVETQKPALETEDAAAEEASGTKETPAAEEAPAAEDAAPAAEETPAEEEAPAEEPKAEETPVAEAEESTEAAKEEPETALEEEAKFVPVKETTQEAPPPAAAEESAPAGEDAEKEKEKKDP